MQQAHGGEQREQRQGWCLICVLCVMPLQGIAALLAAALVTAHVAS